VLIEQQNTYRTARDEKTQCDVKCACGQEISGWLEPISPETDKQWAEHLRSILINNTTHLRKDQMVESLAVTCGANTATATDFVDAQLSEWSSSLDVKTLLTGETVYHWQRFEVAS